VKAAIISVTRFQQNCSLLACEQTNKAVVDSRADVSFIPGHGPTSTFGDERETNPFVADRVLARA
jgi:hypothetical protein